MRVHMLSIRLLFSVIGKRRQMKLLVLLLFGKSAFLVTLFEFDKPIIIFSSIVALLPGEDLEHARLFVSRFVVDSMAQFFLLRVRQWGGLPHFDSK
jgi:hypothetical protein